MRADYDKLLESSEVKAKIIDFLYKTDYEFYREMSDEMTEEEFWKFCVDFPEARIVRN